jgi:hypothetical protein
MSLQRNFKVGGSSKTAAVLLFALAPLDMCMSAPGQQVEPEPTETIEEIVVYGNKSLIQLRLELYKAENVVFEVFNSLNSDDEFDIHCYKEAPTGSHIKKRVCRTNYVGDLTAAATRLWLLGITGYYSHPVAKIQQKDKILIEEMEALVVERPELLKALNEYSDAKQVLESEHQRRCEGRVFICRK